MSEIGKARERIEADAREWIVANYAALKDGPGIPPKVISSLADFAEAHADAGTIAAIVDEVAYSPDHPEEFAAKAGIKLDAPPVPVEAPKPARTATRRRTTR